MSLSTKKQVLLLLLVPSVLSWSLGDPNHEYELQTHQGDCINFLRDSITYPSQSTLENLHPNISCMRHPDHIGAKGSAIQSQIIRFSNLFFIDSVQFWSHHEKASQAKSLCCISQH